MTIIEFEETTKGCVIKVNEKIVWLIREEQASLNPKEKWFVHKSEDGGRGFRLIPAKITKEENGYILDAEQWG